MAVFGGRGGSNLQDQLLSVITYPLTIKINPDNSVYANASVDMAIFELLNLDIERLFCKPNFPRGQHSKDCMTNILC